MSETVRILLSEYRNQDNQNNQNKKTNSSDGCYICCGDGNGFPLCEACCNLDGDDQFECCQLCCCISCTSFCG